MAGVRVICLSAVAWLTWPLVGGAQDDTGAPSAPVPAEEASAPRAVPVAEAAAAGPREVVPVEAGDVAKDDKTVSSSGQFVIRGAKHAERGLIAMQAEELKGDLLRLLAAEDEWKSPVVVNLRGNPDDPRPKQSVAKNLFLTPQGFRLQLDVNLARGLEHERFEYVVLSLLLYEWTLRGRGGELAGERLRIRPWLVEGLREAIRWRGRRSDRRLYQALFETGGLFDMETMLAATDGDYEKLDAAARAAFRVSAGSLVLALMEQPDGRAAFREFLGEVAVFEGETPMLLRRYFPELNLSEKSLAKWWALQMANMAEAPITEVLSVFETNATLTTALQLHVPDEEGAMLVVEIMDAGQAVELEDADRTAAVRPAQDALVRLSYRCFPSFRPLIASYQEMLKEIAEGEAEELAPRLEELAAIRERMLQRSADGSDYLDWFEITRARAASGEFADYLRLKEELRRAHDRAGDPVSLYLDRMQEAFGR